MESRIRIGDQGDPEFLKQLVKEEEVPWDIVIDDGGHLMLQQITSFEVLYPYVDRKGSLPQGIPYFESPQETFVNHMKYRIDYLNGYWINAEWAPTDPFVTTVDAISFYDGMVVVEKRPHPHPQQ